MATQIFRGKAQISGCSATVTVAASPNRLLKEGLELANDFQEDVIPDENGSDAAWRAYNEKDNGTLNLRFVDMTDPSSEANIETFTAALTPYAIIVITLAKPARFNGSYQLVSGSDYSVVNTTAGKCALKVRKYVDTDQQTLSTTVFTPS